MRPTLLWHIFSVEARKRMSYRADFWINSLGGIAVSFSVFWAITHAMFSSSGKTEIAGYSVSGMLLYYVFASLTGRVAQSNEVELAASQDIYDGSLSRYLLYPVPYAAVKYAQQAGRLAPQILQMIFFGLAAPLLIGIPDEIHITSGTVAMYVLSLAVANLLHYLLLLPIQAVAFWADNVWSLVVASRFTASLLGGLLLPLDMFPPWSRPILDALPFAYLYSLPVRVLLGRASMSEWATGLAIAAGWCLLFAFVFRLIWRRGNLQYTGVGI
ncbi:MAG: hypothetical protein EXQ56_12885 [Acidobacteria bacterium]|nr:hypothetical protein [Acidobacteriota bacterium]